MVKCWVVDVVVVRGISKYYTRRFGKTLELILQCWVVDVVVVVWGYQQVLNEEMSKSTEIPNSPVLGCGCCCC